VNIPDAVFLAALINRGLDTNRDGQISYAECEVVRYLDVFLCSINDLTGIEAFVNMDSLKCSNNRLTKLDITKNTALTYLKCSDNQLTSLDLSNNTKLTYLSCSNNKLTILDIIKNTNLTELFCYFNQLKSLDVSACTVLKSIYCNDNKLTSLDLSDNPALITLDCSRNILISLDVSHNTALRSLKCGGNKLTSLDISNNIELFKGGNVLELNDNPNLKQVCVWEIPFPPVEYSNLIYSPGSPDMYFTTDCTLEISPSKLVSKITIRPNPSEGKINIDFGNPVYAGLEIFDVRANLIYKIPKLSNHQTIDISAYPPGVYLIEVKEQGILRIMKVVIR